jgi:hypothetical protein
MGLDIRLPIGLVFLIVGLIMLAYGAFTWGSPMYAASEGLNIKIIWGSAMMAFGGVMFALSRRRG